VRERRRKEYPMSRFHTNLLNSGYNIPHFQDTFAQVIAMDADRKRGIYLFLFPLASSFSFLLKYRELVLVPIQSD
jgi:hypothetical protein